MKTSEMKLGIKLEMEIINSIGERIGQSYVSQLMDIIDKDNITIAAPIHEARLMLITNGTRIRIVFLHDRYGLLTFNGFITSKQKRENIIEFYINVQYPFEKIQRRTYFRLGCFLDTLYRVCEEDETPRMDMSSGIEPIKYYKAITKDLSGSGACVVTDEKVEKGAIVEVKIKLRENVAMNAFCKVMRVSEKEASKNIKYELGLFFSKISQRDQDLVIKYIFDQQRLMLKNNIMDRE